MGEFPNRDSNMSPWGVTTPDAHQLCAPAHRAAASMASSDAPGTLAEDSSRQGWPGYDATRPGKNRARVRWQLCICYVLYSIQTIRTTLGEP